MVLSLVGGKYQIVSLNRDPFPSLEAYMYIDGQHVYTIAQLVSLLGGRFGG